MSSSFIPPPPPPTPYSTQLMCCVNASVNREERSAARLLPCSYRALVSLPERDRRCVHQTFVWRCITARRRAPNVVRQGFAAIVGSRNGRRCTFVGTAGLHCSRLPGCSKATRCLFPARKYGFELRHFKRFNPNFTGFHVKWPLGPARPAEHHFHEPFFSLPERPKPF